MSGAVRTYRIHVALDDSVPLIWRRLELRSDLRLDVVHQVLQAAFGWTDSHLHRFAVGGHPFDPDARVFLCPFEVAEGESDGVPASDVRLDEVMAGAGEPLHYVYDYGDSWELTLKLEQVLPFSEGSPAAVCTAGERAAPPEDSGGHSDLASLGRLLDDPARFDTSEVDAALAAAIARARLHPRLTTILAMLESTGADLADDLQRALEDPPPSHTELEHALRPYRWFLARAEDGLPLTASGYLKPDDTRAAADLVASAVGWIGTRNRESHTYPVLAFRQSLQAMGLLRKLKGALVLTPLGRRAHGDRDVLVDAIAAHLLGAEDGPELDTRLLVLAHAAAFPDTDIPLERVASQLTELGWRMQSGGAVTRDVVLGSEVVGELRELNPDPAHRRERRVSAVASYVAARAIQRRG